MKKDWVDINDPAFCEIIDVNVDADAYADRDEETEQEELEAGDALAEQLRQEDLKRRLLHAALAEFNKLSITERPC